MRVLDQNGVELNNPDLARGYLQEETLLVATHPATPEIPEITEQVLLSEDPNNPKNRLYKTVVVQSYAPARESWTETETICRYIPYTAAELAEFERHQAEADRAAAEARAKQERLEKLPAEVDDLYEGVAEIGVLASDATATLDDVLEAIAELGAMVAGKE